MKLVKIKEGYIVISDEEIKEDDWVYNSFDCGFAPQVYTMPSHPNKKEGEWWDREELETTKRIIASTFIPSLPLIDFNCNEDKVGYVDVEKLADDWINKNNHKWSNNNDECGDNYGSFISGFNKSQELNKNKYSENDMWISYVRGFQANEEKKKPLEDFKDVIQSSQEWDVEVEIITNNQLKILKIMKHITHECYIDSSDFLYDYILKERFQNQLGYKKEIKKSETHQNDPVPQLPILYGNRFKIEILTSKDDYSNPIQSIFTNGITNIASQEEISRYLKYYLSYSDRGRLANTIEKLSDDYRANIEPSSIIFELTKEQTIEFMDLAKKSFQGLEI